MCASIVVLTFDLVLPSKILKITGHVRGYSIGFIVLSIMTSLTWTTARMHNSKWTFSAMLFIFSVMRVAMTVMRIACFVILKNVTPHMARGRVLAVHSCLTMGSRTFGHMIFGELVAWSLSNIKHTFGTIAFPLNEPFSFYAIAFVCFIGAAVSIMCNEDAEKPLNEGNI